MLNCQNRKRENKEGVKMKNKKIVSILNYLTAVCFYIAAMLGYVNDSSMATVWLCLGSVWLCLGSYWLMKSKKDGKEDQDEEDKK